MSKETSRTCRACYKTYAYPQPRGRERIDDGYCSGLCADREQQVITPADVGDVSSVLGPIIEVAVDVFTPSTSSDDTSSTGADWSSSDPDSGSGFGGGGASGDF